MSEKQKQAPSPHVINLAGLRPEPHVDRALRTAMVLAQGKPLDAAGMLRAAVIVSRSHRTRAFLEVASRLQLGHFPEPDNEDLDRLDLKAVPASPGLAGSFAIARTFLDKGIAVWGRDYVTIAVLSQDRSLQDIAREGRTDVATLQDDWYRFVTSERSHRDIAEWEEWWRAADVPLPDGRADDEALPTYLLTWNAARTKWSGLARHIEEIRTQGSSDGHWSMGNRNRVVVGARVFLMRQGAEPRGLVGAGRVTGQVAPAPHWDANKAGKKFLRAPVRWEKLSRDPIVGLRELRDLSAKHSLWSTRAGGVTIPARLARRVEDAWSRALSGETPPPEADKRPQPPANDLPAGEDLLDIKTEVEALAESIALHKTSPPLVVGVLGGWGAGKSFVLHLFEKRLQEIRCYALGEGDAGARTFPYVGHPYVIRFDSWTYAKSDLWASLMRQIFVELDRQLSVECAIAGAAGRSLRTDTTLWLELASASDKRRRQILKSELGTEALEKASDRESLWEALETLREKEVKDLETAEVNLQTALQKVNKEREESESAIRALQDKRAKWIAFRPVLVAMRELLGEEKARAIEAMEQDGKAPPTIDDVRRELPFLKRILASSTPVVIGMLAFAIFLIAVPFLMETESYQKIFGIVTGTGGAGLAVWEWFRKRLQRTEEILRAYYDAFDKARASQAARDETEVAAKRADVEATHADQIAVLKKKVERHRRRVGLTAERSSLLDLIRDRVEGRSYEKRLGLMHQIQGDLRELSEALLPESELQTPEHRELFSRGDPRIVVIIDDLDRCPPRRVVEVLEAAQLLVKTNLFVVVLAMDVRYVTRALEKVYEDILVRDGAPSGLDYIEKIVQIPYRVRPIAPSALEDFLRKHVTIRSEAPMHVSPSADEPPADVPPEEVVEVEVSAEDRERAPDVEDDDDVPLVSLDPIPTEVMEFEEHDLRALRDACKVTDISPRSVKRIANVFKLLKIVWHRREPKREPDEKVKRVMALLLALAARHPVVLRELLPALEEAFVAPNNIEDKTVLEFLVEACDNGLERLSEDSPLREQWERSQKILTAEKKGAGDDGKVHLAELGRENARLVSSFSFVGDSTWEHQAELTEPISPAQTLPTASTGMAAD